MTARYKGAIVRVVRVEVHRAYIVLNGMIKRVNKCDIEIVTDAALIAGLAVSLLCLSWAVLR